MTDLAYKRILLKLSGEILAGKNDFGLDAEIISFFVQEIRHIHSLKCEIGLVIGGGNIFRGASTLSSIDRVQGDKMGMLATIINALALQDAFIKNGIPTSVMTPLSMPSVTDSFSSLRAKELLRSGHVVIFAGGTGNPFFTTDTAAALRAGEINAELLLKGTKVDGVYDKDPAIHNDAIKYDTISYDTVIKNNLKVMDIPAIAICRDNHIPLAVFNFQKPNNLFNLISGNDVGTKVGD